jgi:hypothetical protein
MHLIIDADPIVYRAGFASERTDYHLILETPAGALLEKHFTARPGKTAGAQMKDYLDKHKGFDILSKEKLIHPDSEEECLNAVRTQINAIEKACRESPAIGDLTGITTILSGPGNYREGLATVFPYKGNRDPEHKPHWYQSIRNLLTGEFAARVVHGREADDECSILGWQHIAAGTSFVIATIDKDLDQIPGLHYNYHRCVVYRQSREAARMFFWQQALSGDPTDGIPGCWRTGELKAAAFVDDYAGESDAVIWQELVQRYRDSQEIPGCPYERCKPEAVALETARLVYLQKQPYELWNPPGTPFGTIGDEDDK